VVSRNRGSSAAPHPDDAIDAIGWYLLEVTEVTVEDLQMAFSRQLHPTNGDFMSTAERLRTEGRLEGRAEGRAEALLRILNKRFGAVPADIAPRVRGLRADDLDRCIDRAIDATSMDDVFANP